MRPRRAGRRLGQNFLAKGGAVRRIVEALAPRPGEKVLEIGPGRGALTAELIKAAGRVTAVEIDAELCSALEARFGKDLLALRREDILKVDLAEFGPGLVIAGNLPYSISKPIAMKMVAERDQIDRAVLMFQREVADRLTAKVGSRSYGPLTVLAGQAYVVSPLFDLPASAFRPRPKVTSTVTIWRPRSQEELEPEFEKVLRACLAAAFARRRQTLRNNLRAALASKEVAERLLDAAELDGSLRAEMIEPSGFIRLAKLWRSL
jgi:16S rRNA (adenine1518-N6/adenine1519-N6)-dimethyltransferase